MEEMVIGSAAVETGAVAVGKGLSMVTMGLAGAGVLVGGYALYKGGQKVMSMYKEREAKKDAILETKIRAIVESSLDDMEKRITEKVSEAAAVAAAKSVENELSKFFNAVEEAKVEEVAVVEAAKPAEAKAKAKAKAKVA